MLEVTLEVLVKKNADFFISFLEVLPEMESQAEYEGQNFNFTSPDNMDNSGSQNLTKLTTANMEDMEEYYNFGKDTSSYTTPWGVTNQRMWVFFVFSVGMGGGHWGLFSFGLWSEEPELPDSLSEDRGLLRCTSRVSAPSLLSETVNC